MTNYEFEYTFSFDGGDLIYVELSILSFRNYISLVEANFESQRKILTEKHSELINAPSSHFLERHNSGEELKELEEKFIQRFRQSIIIQIFSYVESELKSICYHIRNILKALIQLTI